VGLFLGHAAVDDLNAGAGAPGQHFEIGDSGNVHHAFAVGDGDLHLEGLSSGQAVPIHTGRHHDFLGNCLAGETDDQQYNEG
jgi:hypothetical protein